jgi:hypothetical protein
MTGPVGYAEQELRTSQYAVRDAITRDTLTYTTVTEQLDPLRFTIEKAKAAIALPSGFEVDLKLNRRLYYGDHWLDGIGWKGPWPMLQEGATSEEAAGVQEMWAEIMRGFTPRNAIAECIERHDTGVVGIEPTWTWTPDGVKVRTPRQLRTPAIAQVPPPQPKPVPVPLDPNADPNAPPPPPPAPKPVPTPTPEDAASAALVAKVETLNGLLTTWWDEHNCADLFQQYVRSLLYGRVATFRIHIAPSALVPEMATKADGTSVATGRKLLNIKDVEDALSKIHVEVIDADGGRVVRDRNTLADVGVRLAKRGDTVIAHVTYLDELQRTTIAVVDQTSGAGTAGSPQQPAARISFDLGGRLLMHTSVREAFVTEQVRQNQYALNYANTVIQRNLTTAGFLETTYTNVHLEGEWKTIRGRRRLIPDPILRGPTVTNSLQGTKTEDAQGGETIATPGVHDRQPVDPAPTIAAKREAYADILHECDQIHILIAGDAVASGVSRQQATSDHISSMNLTKSNVQRAGRWMIETVTAFAHALASPNGDGASAIAGLRVAFTCFLDPGPLDAAERAQNTADVGAGTLSVETCIERNGINDVDAELDRIDAARAVDLEVKRAAIFGAWITAGADEAFAGYRAGLSPAEIERMATAFVAPQPVVAVDPNAPPKPGEKPATPPKPGSAAPPATNGSKPTPFAKKGAPAPAGA